jgi:hypothetical protein
MLHAMERGIEGAFLDAEHVRRRLLDAAGDGVAMERSLLQHLEDQEIEGSLEKGLAIGAHT